MAKKKQEKTEDRIVVPRKAKLPTGDVLTDLKDICGGDEKVVLFFVLYLQNGLNATKAYMAMNPSASAKTAGVLGARMLAKVRKSAILDALNIGAQQYIEQIREGMEATVTDTITVKLPKKKGKDDDFKIISVKKPDWQTRSLYHSKLGNILGIEGKSVPGVAIQVNQNNNIESLPDDDLDLFLNR